MHLSLIYKTCRQEGNRTQAHPAEEKNTFGSTMIGPAKRGFGSKILKCSQRRGKKGRKKGKEEREEDK